MAGLFLRARSYLGLSIKICSPTHITTIGVDFKDRIVDVDGRKIKLQVKPGGFVCFFYLQPTKRVTLQQRRDGTLQVLLY